MKTTTVAVVPEGLLRAGLRDSASGPSTQNATSLPFVRLLHPRTSLPTLFLPHSSVSEDGKQVSQILEIQSVSPDNKRSWFLKDSIVSDGNMLLFTPVDPVFLLIPILRSASNMSTGEQQRVQFRTIDDIFEAASITITGGDASSSSQKEVTSQNEDRPITSSDIMKLAELDCVKRALPYLCECKDIAEDFLVYRYSEEKLVDHLRTKITRLADPAVFGTFRTLTRGLARSGLSLEEGGLEGEKRASLEALAALARIKAACDVVSQYLPPDLYARLLQSYDFTLLEEHLQSLALEDIQPEPTIPQKRKKATNGGNTVTAEKEDKRKASRGVELLKKVDTKGMNKLSSFFQKKPAGSSKPKS